ncbi:MAG TPA: S9 family peptidase [Acidobacteriota bacterium]
MKLFSRILICSFLFSAAAAQVQEIIPGDNLVLDGIPKIPASLTESVDRYTQARSATLVDWHPVRREMLIRTRFADTFQIHLVKMPGGARTQMTFFAEPVNVASFQPRQGDYFVYLKDAGGNEFYQIYRLDLSTGKSALLTDGRSRNILGRWSSGGDRVAYTSTRRNGKDLDIYVVTPTDPKSDRKLVELQGGGWDVLDWSPDDRKLLVMELVSANESYLWLFDSSSGEKTLLTAREQGEKVMYRAGRFSTDGKGIYAATDFGSDFQRLAYIDLATKKPSFLTTHIPWDVEEFDLSSDGKWIVFATNEDGASVLRLLDTANRREKPLPKLPNGMITDIKFHPNGKEFGFSFLSAQASDVYSVDIRIGKLERWTSSEMGGLNPENFHNPELVRWKSFDGKMISGFVYKPMQGFTGKRPVMIEIHGGPEDQFRPRFLGRRNYFINEMGVALIYPNVRGSSGYGKSFLKLDNGTLRDNSYKDIAALLDWIRTQPDLDADRVLVTGGSYGGFMTLAVATNYSDRIRCALDIVGPSNLVTFLERTESYRRDLRRAEYGDERDPSIREYLEKIAPMNHASDIRKPLFVIQGKNDPRVPASESEQIVQTVKKNGTPVWYLMAKDEGHGFAKKKNVDFQFYATILFMQEYLLK